MVTLQALRHGIVVVAVSVTLLGGFFNRYTLSLQQVEGGFRRLRVVGSGPTQRGTFFALIDSISISR